MAKTDGVISFSGSIGNITYVQTRNGSYTRRRTGPSKDKIMNSPNYARLRDHISEFRQATQANALLRGHLLPFIGRCKDARLARRLNTVILEAVRLDKVNPMGQRNILDGELLLLEHFEFNSGAGLSGVLHTDIAGSINRATGEVSVSVTSFVPETALKYMPGATHVRISIAAAAVNFTTGEMQKQFSDGNYLPVGKQLTGPLTLSVSLPAGLTDPVLLLLKLQYFQEVNGDMLERFDASCNTCTILKVDTGV